MNFKIGDRVRLTPDDFRRGLFNARCVGKCGRVTSLLGTPSNVLCWAVIVLFDNRIEQHCALQDLTPEMVNGWAA